MRWRGLRRNLALSILLLALASCVRRAGVVEETPPGANGPGHPAVSSNGWTLLVRTDGPRWLGPDWWAAQGLDSTTLRPGSLRLTQNGDSIPFVWSSSPKGSGLLFLGETEASSYGPVGAYQLTLSEDGDPSFTFSDHPLAPGAVSDTACQTTTLASTWHARDLVFRSTAPLDPPFLWQSMRPPDTFTFPVALTGVIATHPVTLTVRIWGQSDMPENPDHHLRVVWDEVVVDDHKWDGDGVESWQVTLPVTQDEVHTLTLSAPGGTGAEIDQMWLDGFGLAWPRAFMPVENGWQQWTADSRPFACWDVGAARTETTYVALVSGRDGKAESWRFDGDDEGTPLCVPQSADATGWIGMPWHAPPPDLVRSQQVISHSDLVEIDYLVIAPSLFHKALLPLMALRQEEGYATYILTPEAVWDTFGGGAPGAESIRDMVQTLVSEGRLQYLLLVGDTLPGAAGFWNEDHAGVPTGWVRTIHVGYTASDALLVMDDANHPLVSVGRLPVSTPEELVVLVAKTLAWEATDRLLLFNDDEPSFADLRRQLSDISQAEDQIEIDASTLKGARDDLIRWLDKGPGTVVYVGHASMAMLGDEKYLVAEDAGHVGPAVMVTWSCLCAGFAHPTYESLAEAWLLRPQGAVAVVGPTGETTTGEQAAMALAFQSQLVQGQTIGQALLHAWQDGQSLDAVHGFVLLGDPALRPLTGESSQASDAPTQP